MKVKDLIEKLSKLDPELEVFVSRDPEGNGYHKVSTVDLGSYDSSETYYWEHIGVAVLTEELKAQGYTEEDLLDTKCVCIWP